MMLKKFLGDISISTISTEAFKRQILLRSRMPLLAVESTFSISVSFICTPHRCVIEISQIPVLFETC